MSKILMFAVVVLAPSLALAQSDTAATVKQIEALERAVDSAVQKGDLAAFTANVADDAVLVDGTGATPGSEFGKMFGQLKITTSAIDRVNVKLVNESTAVITYRWTGK